MSTQTAVKIDVRSPDRRLPSRSVSASEACAAEPNHASAIMALAPGASTGWVADGPRYQIRLTRAA